MDAGWYIDPDDPTSGRYHDGTVWTDNTVEIPEGKTLAVAPTEATESDRPPRDARATAASRDRLLISLFGTLIVAVVVATAVIYATRPTTSPTRVESAGQTRPGASDACQLAFTRQLAVSTPGTDPADALTACSAAEWTTVYVHTAAALGQTSVNGTAALQSACLPWQSNPRPQACRTVQPPAGR